MKKRCLILTGGGDCPGLNAVIRAIVKRAEQEGDWEIIGSIDAFNGVLKEPMELEVLTKKRVAGIHIQGGTILGTTNTGGPFAWPVKDKDGNTINVDRSDDLVKKLQYNNIDAVINIGGDGSQRISQALYEKGVNIIGVPKTIDNDLSSTDFTFGFQTAVEIATDAVDKLMTTAASHHRVMILEVMGRDAGWIALHSAIAGGAEACLIPEIPYDITKVVEALNQRITFGKGFANIVIAEGALLKKDKSKDHSDRAINKDMIIQDGAAYRLQKELKEAGIKSEMRTTILGHIQRGGIPCAQDRILATQFGVKAFEMVVAKEFGKMVVYRQPDVTSVSLKEAIKKYNYVDVDSNLVKTAKGIGICFGD